MNKREQDNNSAVLCESIKRHLREREAAKRVKAASEWVGMAAFLLMGGLWIAGLVAALLGWGC
jgi:hypothetical protein